MAIAAGAVVPLDVKRRRRHDLLAQLREVDHWRRLVAARLDLAVAAVTAIDEPSGEPVDGLEGSLPRGLREILGLPACDQALPEAAVLVRLRAAQRDLDDYARTLRESTDLATLELAALMDAQRRGLVGHPTGPDRTTEPDVERPARRAGRRGRESGSTPPAHLRVVSGNEE